jgi:hypothetical protein
MLAGDMVRRSRYYCLGQTTSMMWAYRAAYGGSAVTWKYHRQSPFPAGGEAPDGALFNFVLDRVSETQVIARGEMFIERDLILVDLVEDETSWLL